jgi:hypothetical protein
LGLPGHHCLPLIGTISARVDAPFNWNGSDEG